MSSESWLKISLPACPVGFAVFVVGLYWRENILALLPPSLAFWGLMILYYIFSTWEVPGKRYPLFLTILLAVLWFGSSLTAHSLGRFVASGSYSGVTSVLPKMDFWYAYLCGFVSSAVGLHQFRRFEPLIVAQAQKDRARHDEENT